MAVTGHEGFSKGAALRRPGAGGITSPRHRRIARRSG